MTYKAEQARLFSTADDVNFEVVQIYQTIYMLTRDILGVQGEVAEGERNVQVLQAQQQQGVAEPLTAIQKELNLIGKQDELQNLELRLLTNYARLQRAAGGSWKWIP
jgi:outer membrane protein TolC